MEVETDNAEVKVQIGVGFRTCKNCGETFAKDIDHPKRTVCQKCRRKNRNGIEEIRKTDAQFREMKRCEQNEAQKRRDRMRKRDSDYARWERENGVSPRFEDHGYKIVEIRGHVG